MPFGSISIYLLPGHVVGFQTDLADQLTVNQSRATYLEAGLSVSTKLLANQEAAVTFKIFKR